MFVCMWCFQGVLDRFSQIQPKVIFSVEAVRYNGKVHPHLSKLQKVVEGLPALEKVILFPFCGLEYKQMSNIRNWLELDRELVEAINISGKILLWPACTSFMIVINCLNAFCGQSYVWHLNIPKCKINTKRINKKEKQNFLKCE